MTDTFKCPTKQTKRGHRADPEETGRSKFMQGIL